MTWTVKKDKGVICKFVQLVDKPVYVLNKVLHAIYKATVWAEVFELLDVVK